MRCLRQLVQPRLSAPTPCVRAQKQVSAASLSSPYLFLSWRPAPTIASLRHEPAGSVFAVSAVRGDELVCSSVEQGRGRKSIGACNRPRSRCSAPRAARTAPSLRAQAAECILRIAEKANAPVIYLSTDAAESETNLLQSLVVFNDRQVPLVKRPEHHSSEKWDAVLYRNHMGGDNQVDAMLDKTICALSNVFIGSSGSTFTEDIFRLLRGWGSACHCDECTSARVSCPTT